MTGCSWLQALCSIITLVAWLVAIGYQIKINRQIDRLSEENRND